MTSIWCKRCGVHVAPRVSQRQEYVTVDVVDEHRARDGRLTGTTSRPTQQVRTVRLLNCPQCGAGLESTAARVGRTLSNIVAVACVGLFALAILVPVVVRNCARTESAPTRGRSAVVVTADEENVRQQPGGKVIGKVQRNTTLTVRTVPNTPAGWVPVNCCGGKAGYIWAASVQAANADTAATP